ncbi:MAG: hypothetical protein K6A23_01120 [Butyrivibrio sp.]|nr:hypothetical protein [Butyrivibrio sp.]
MPKTNINDLKDLSKEYKVFGNMFGEFPYYDSTSNYIDQMIANKKGNDTELEDGDYSVAMVNETAIDSLKIYSNFLIRHKLSKDDIARNTIIDYIDWINDRVKKREYIGENNPEFTKYGPLASLKIWNKLQLDELKKAGELNEVFKKSNISQVIYSARDYYDELRNTEIESSLKTLSKEEDAKLRNKLIEKAQAYHDALNNAIQIDPDDKETVQKLYGSEKNMSEALEGFAKDRERAAFEIKYLKSGLPIATMDVAYNSLDSAKNIEDHLKNKEDIKQENEVKAAEELVKAVDNIPGADASEEEKNKYCKNVVEKINKCKAEIADNPDHEDIKHFSDKINAQAPIFSNMEIVAEGSKNFEEGLNHYLTTFNNTFIYSHHDNSSKYTEMVDALADYKKKSAGITNGLEKINALKEVKNKAHAYTQSKHFWEGWKGDGGVRYENAKALEKYVDFQIMQIRSILNMQNAKTIKVIDMDSLKHNLINNEVKEAHINRPVYKEYPKVTKDITNYYYVIYNEALNKRAVSANDSPQYLGFINGLKNCYEASKNLYRAYNKGDRAIIEAKKNYSVAIDRLKDSAKAYEDYKLKDHTRFPELEANKEKLNSKDKEKLELTDKILYNTRYLNPIKNKRAKVM